MTLQSKLPAEILLTEAKQKIWTTKKITLLLTLHHKRNRRKRDDIKQLMITKGSGKYTGKYANKKWVQSNTLPFFPVPTPHNLVNYPISTTVHLSAPYLVPTRCQVRILYSIIDTLRRSHSSNLSITYQYWDNEMINKGILKSL